MTDFLRSVADLNCCTRFCRPLPTDPFAILRGKDKAIFWILQYLTAIYLDKVTLVAAIFPPSGGFSFETLIVTWEICGKAL